MISFFCVLAPEGMNSIVFGREKGEGTEACYLLSPLCWTFFQVSLMTGPFFLPLVKENNLLDDRSSEQVVVFWFFLFRSPKTIAFIPSEAKTQKIKRIDHRNCIMWERVNKIPWQKYLPKKQKISDLFPLSPPKDYWIHSFWSQNTENKKNRL